MTVTILAAVSLVLALIPALLFLANLRLYRTPRPCTRSRRVSILIPARNEERSIGAAVKAALRSRGVELEILVLDDHSEDRTAVVVEDIAARDCRVRLVHAPPLPAGWCGKQHACWVLSQHAAHELLLFLDADVELHPDGVAALVGFMDESGADLVSGIPRQETGTLLEKLLIPLIHFVLLGFLPMAWMRSSPHPAYGSGCGQLFLARRSAYEKAGGHAAIRATLHDGIRLPRAFRAVGCMTDLCDATDLATCRMYRTGPEAWHGLAKNATEGLAAPGLILPATALLLGGQVLPLVALVLAWWGAAWDVALAGVATGLTYLPRLLGAWRFRQSWLGAVFHPAGVLILLAIQWYAFTRWLLGKPCGWKGRAYSPGKGERHKDPCGTRA